MTTIYWRERAEAPPRAANDDRERAPRPLAAKLARIAGEIGRPEPDADAALEAVRAALAREGVAVLPTVRDHFFVELDALGAVRMTTVALEVTLLDGESGDEVAMTWLGQGSGGSAGYYEAYASAMRAALLGVLGLGA